MDYLLDALKSFLSYIMEYIRPIIEKLLSPIADNIPDMTPQVTSLVEYFNFVNDWIALDVGFSMLGFYMVFIVSMISVKLIVKLFIPTVG